MKKDFELDSISNIPQINSMRILVVDDHRMNRMLATTTILKSYPGCIVEQAENGSQALSMMRVINYDFVLLDIFMPDVDGITVLRTVRKYYPNIYSSAKFFAFTANSDLYIYRECLDAGFDGFIDKAFAINDFLRCVDRALI